MKTSSYMIGVEVVYHALDFGLSVVYVLAFRIQRLRLVHVSFDIQPEALLF
jgi:hypothetical protein